MNSLTRLAMLVLMLALTALLVGCPGMPGAPGGGGSAAQQTPPGILPPPGLESGGARTLMGATVTPPNNQILLVSYTMSDGPTPGRWWSVRRLTFVESGVMLEGLNYDGRAADEEKDANRLVPLLQLTSLAWRYEPKPAPPAPAKPPASAGKATSEPGPKRGR